MGIQLQPVSVYWNYFFCLEEDVEKLARWIEPNQDNFNCYSVELARLLMAASAEVDVLAKAICKKLAPNESVTRINGYQRVLTRRFPQFPGAEVTIPKYGLVLHPWENWHQEQASPLWWKAYNNVKHHRASYFNEATLKNVLNAIGALVQLLIIYHGETQEEFTTIPKLFLSNSFSVTIGGKMLYMPNR